MKMFYFFIFLFFCSLSAFSQNNTDSLQNFHDSTIKETDKGIPFYDKYNNIIGGDSLRYCNGIKCSGFIKDYYPDGKIKHKGYYVNGQLTSIYKNYYNNEQLERSFKVNSSKKSTVTIYYKNGILRSKGKYLNDSFLEWEDYYPNGNLESSEENNKSLDYYIHFNFYYENGNPQNTLELIDKKNKIYSSKEFFENGQVKQEGKRIQNQAINDYFKSGKWLIYNEKGELIDKEIYVRGELIDEASTTKDD